MRCLDENSVVEYLRGELEPKKRQDGRLRVVDFGLAKSTPAGVPGQAAQAVLGEDRELDDSGGRVVLGTPAYMAPEQWRAQKITSARTSGPSA